jgi:hypothetical protein
MVSQATKQRIEQMRKERGLEKQKIQQSILMSKHEEAKMYKSRLASDMARKESHQEYQQRMAYER